ncbi:Hypothetical predicted protein [Mytilus galloprovincialis]|uniref:Uncharacterized protein n=1 Tax=Mytilus galloprovincialis TaxID=29158 RepID=A0A8B6F344_MYTGA|nr:Hypothetical predicted protein [Mytilus galloprovincialis]
MRDKWEHWKDSLQGLHQLSIPRFYATFSWRDTSQREVYVYCDASEKSIAAVAFLQATDSEDAATRSVPPDKLQDSMWLNGPLTLCESSKDLIDTYFPLLNTEQDKEIRPNVQVMKTGEYACTYSS